jgi:ubiquinone/menaquinone biosynthesis C-methylase UbiE
LTKLFEHHILEKGADSMDIEKMQAQFNMIAEKYDNQRKCFIPCFEDFYVRSVSLLKQNHFTNIVDLGAGTGLLTKVLYEMFPKAQYTLIDISKDMLKIAKERFNGLDNFTLLEHDYVQNIPVQNADLISSALSIHHLEHTEKSTLYKHIYSKLNTNGVFINLDQFIAKSEKINNAYNEWWLNYIDNSGIQSDEKEAWLQRKTLDKENTIDETVQLLEKSGFTHVECIYHFMKFGVIIAAK